MPCTRVGSRRLALRWAVLLAVIAGPTSPLATMVSANPLDQEGRIEIPVKHSDDYQVVPVGDRGVVVVGATSGRGESTASIVLHDVDFQRLWEQDLALPGGHKLRTHAFDGDELHLFFHKNRSADWIQVSLALDDGAKTVTTVQGPGRMTGLEEVAVVNDQVYVVGNTRKGDTLLHHVLGETGASAVPIDEASGPGKWLDVQRLIPGRGELEVDLELRKTNKRRPQVALLGLARGEVVDPLLLGEGMEDSDPRSAQRFLLGDGGELIVGTYASRELQQGAQGLYVGTRSGDGLRDVELHSFSDFENFFDYLPERRQQRLEKKAERKKAKGSDLNLDFRLQIHDIVDQGERYLMLAEVYRPEYTTYTVTTTTMVNGVATPTTTTYTVFIGWRYTHAILAALDRQGRLQWDHCFKIGDVLTMKRREYIKVLTEGDRVLMLYNHGGSVFTKIVQGDEVLDDREVTEQEPMEDDEKIKKSWSSGAAYWYERNFLLWGYQKVKDPGEGKRKVFYFTKVSAT